MKVVGALYFNHSDDHTKLFNEAIVLLNKIGLNYDHPMGKNNIIEFFGEINHYQFRAVQKLISKLGNLSYIEVENVLEIE